MSTATKQNSKQKREAKKAKKAEATLAQETTLIVETPVVETIVTKKGRPAKEKPAKPVEDTSATASFYLNMRANRKHYIRDFREKGYSSASDDSLAFCKIACQVIKQKVEEGEKPLFITVRDCANIVQSITGIDVLAKGIPNEEAFKQGLHRASKYDTHECKPDKVTARLVDTWAIGRLSDNLPFFAKELIAREGEQKGQSPRLGDMRLFLVAPLMGEYLAFAPDNDTLQWAAYQSVRKSIAKH